MHLQMSKQWKKKLNLNNFHPTGSFAGEIESSIKDVDKLYSDLKRTKIQKNKKRERQFSKA